jgi:hypothetical protein
VLCTWLYNARFGAGTMYVAKASLKGRPVRNAACEGRLPGVRDEGRIRFFHRDAAGLCLLAGFSIRISDLLAMI